MRGALGLVMLAGCFTPAPPSNVPCDPDDSHCPTGQMCFGSPAGYVCADHDPGGGPIDGPSGIDAAFNDAATNAVSKTYTATIAECLAPSFPSPMLCRSYNGNAQLVIDTKDSTTLDPWSSYIRFEIDNALQGKVITKVQLRLVATNDNKAPGPSSGSVFEVQPFTLASLTGTTPQKVGAQLAGNQGSVSKNQTKNWSLPPSLVELGKPVYLGLYANDDDGVNYWNLDGTTPPRLIIDAQ